VAWFLLQFFLAGFGGAHLPPAGPAVWDGQ